MPNEPEQLFGGNMGPVWRVGDTVIRESGEWTPAVHRLLNRLNTAGVRGVPQPLGFESDGREILTLMHGAVPSYPLPAGVWTDRALTSAVALLRQVHDATVGHALPGPWRTATRYPGEVICHNDFAPYNLVFDGDEVVGAFDWDRAAPGPRLRDLAYLAYRFVPITTADWGDPYDADERQNRLTRLLRVYGTEAQPRDLLDALVPLLFERAHFAEETAQELGKPQLHAVASLYRADAAHARVC